MRQLIFCALAASLFLMTSCQKEDIQPTNSPFENIIDVDGNITAEPFEGDGAGIPDVDISNEPGTSTNENTVLSHLKNNPDFSTFYSAIFKTGMADQLDGNGPFTFFVPDNQAFITFLNSNNWNTIDDVPLNTLTLVVKFHISDTHVMIGDLTNGVSVPIMYNDKTVYINMDDPSNPFVVLGLTSAVVVESDITLSNGVIHHINGVLSL